MKCKENCKKTFRNVCLFTATGPPELVPISGGVGLRQARAMMYAEHPRPQVVMSEMIQGEVMARKTEMMHATGLAMLDNVTTRLYVSIPYGRLEYTCKLRQRETSRFLFFFVQYHGEVDKRTKESKQKDDEKERMKKDME